MIDDSDIRREIRLRRWLRVTEIVMVSTIVLIVLVQEVTCSALGFAVSR